jgi:hypothetical protein
MDAEARTARALKLAHDTVEEARRQLDAIAEEAEDAGLDLSDEIDAAVNDLMFAMNRFVDCVTDGLAFMETGEAVAEMSDMEAGEESHALH